VEDGDPVAAADAFELTAAVRAGALELDEVRVDVTVPDRAVRLVHFSTSLAGCQVRAAVLSFYTGRGERAIGPGSLGLVIVRGVAAEAITIMREEKLIETG
jgi:hypothetical protein